MADERQAQTVPGKREPATKYYANRHKIKEKKSCSDIYSLIFYTIPDCNDCSETTDAVRRKQEKD